MHHMADFERLAAPGEENPNTEHVGALLEFLQPRHRQWYIPAKERSLAATPTTKFDDLWVIMKPDSLAYTHHGGQKIGCVIGKSIRFSVKPSDNALERWEIDVWFLQVHWPSDQIGCVRKTVMVEWFDGEMPITSLSLYPAEFLDAEDQGLTKQRFTSRGKQVCDILWGRPRQMEYDGECMVRSGQNVSTTSSSG
jgi:hypothetical protein